jgi:multiple sugar transport system substrate-binding protein
MSGKLRILVRKFEPFEIIVRDFWEQFKARYNVDLEMEQVALPLPELHAAILTGDFDVAHVNTDWLSECWERGCLENLTPYIDAAPPEDYPEGWANALLKLQTFPEGIAGIPFHDGPECLIYRKDLFESPAEQTAYRERYGAELKPPETWGEFAQVAEFFNRPDENLYGTLFALYPDGHNNIFDYALQVWSRGGDLTDSRGNIILNSPTAVEAMSAYRKLIRRPFIHPKSRELESIGACWTFARGEVAMMVNWFGFATMCETVEGSKTKGCVDICAVPHSAGYDAPVSLNVYYTWSISAKSTYKQTAYDYIRNCVTRENDTTLPMKGAIGCRRSTWFDPCVNKLIPYYSRMEQIHSYARTLPRIPQWNGVSRIIDQMVIELIDTLEPAKSIMDRAQVKVEKLMEVL